MSDDDMYELSFFIAYYLNLYKDTQIFISVVRLYRKYLGGFIIGVIHKNKLIIY
mgnify:CR=1 FL=1